MPLAKAPKLWRTPLSESNPDRLQRLEPGAMAGSMDTHEQCSWRDGTVMVDGHEHGCLALTRPGRGHVRAPHDIHGIGPGHLNQPWCHRGCVVHLVFLPGRANPEQTRRACSRIRRNTRRRELLTPSRCSRAQTLRCPSSWKGLCVRTARIARLIRYGQLGIRHGTSRPTSAYRLRYVQLAMPVQGRSGQVPEAADPCRAIGLATGRRDGDAHRRRLARAKGEGWLAPGLGASGRAIFASSSFLSSSISLKACALSRSPCSASSSMGLVERLASPAARNASRQALPRPTVE